MKDRYLTMGIAPPCYITTNNEDWCYMSSKSTTTDGKTIITVYGRETTPVDTYVLEEAQDV